MVRNPCRAQQSRPATANSARRRTPRESSPLPRQPLATGVPSARVLRAGVVGLSAQISPLTPKGSTLLDSLAGVRVASQMTNHIRASNPRLAIVRTASRGLVRLVQLFVECSDAFTTDSSTICAGNQRYAGFLRRLATEAASKRIPDTVGVSSDFFVGKIGFRPTAKRAWINLLGCLLRRGYRRVDRHGDWSPISIAVIQHYSLVRVANRQVWHFADLFGADEDQPVPLAKADRFIEPRVLKDALRRNDRRRQKPFCLAGHNQAILRFLGLTFYPLLA